MQLRAIVISSLAWATFGCAAQDADPPTPLLEAGDPCRNDLYNECADDQRLQRCVDQVWTIDHCDDVCGELGPAYLGDGCADYECECVLADPEGCVPGTTACVDEASLDTCSDSQEWQTASCADVCGAQALLPVGCMVGEDGLASCWCSSEGTPCEAGTPASCADEDNLARCEDGIWVFEPCSSGCEAQGYCAAWSSPAQCVCE